MDDCRASGCCKMLGSKCFEKNAYWSTCLQSCQRGATMDGEPWTCKEKGGRPNLYGIATDKTVTRVAGTSLFCFTVTMPRVPYEQQLAAQQREHGYGIWGCDTALLVSGGSEMDSMQ